ncbi:uncharacterized protein N7496_008500 [Penicillium cataractarum]|uniref:Beta-galactosidase n=1 Tax=Penicillium cataractarum TaxID=2100454 RepID=A0A9W9V6Z5_9EURO|nr:uncharacterized protein N7496_008500 [Penicillium cataractarum]KAJ5368740.1 hypothetical protein N7496_008500 [Penicillium cataractarum]
MLLPWKESVSPLLLLAQVCNAYSKVSSLKPREGTAESDPVIWDSNSMIIGGERLMVYSGEFHPFRLPVPGLWLDIFQKVKAMGFTAVSFYINWALLEGEPGTLKMDGVFDLEPFFDAAVKTGLYLIARPGPYINGEVSGGGFPGWMQRTEGTLRTNASDYLDSTRNYLRDMADMIRKHQITEGGPVIMVQVENEYTICKDYTSSCLNKEYMQFIEDQYHNAGVNIPFSNNDVASIGDFAPGTGAGAVDVYGVDFYPFGYGPLCTNPSNWNRTQTSLTGLPSWTMNHTTHDSCLLRLWTAILPPLHGLIINRGGVGADMCAALLNEAFERVFYKNVYSIGTRILNLYMIFGGTNWGNLGHPLGYSSYDLGSAISEDRQITREKYSEAKLEANFLRVSPAYLTSEPLNGSYGIFTDARDLAVTPLVDEGSGTSFYIVRHGNYMSDTPTSYHWSAITDMGNVSVPQIQNSLTLSGRDSKIHVADYIVGDIHLFYSSAEIFYWTDSSDRSLLILYGGEGETHEFAVPASLPKPTITEGNHDGIIIREQNESIIVNWKVTSTRSTINFGNRLEVLLLWRNEAYNYWVLNSTLSTSVTPYRKGSPLIVSGGYLMRNVSIDDGTINLCGDVNQTTKIEVLAGAPAGVKRISFNGETLKTKRGTNNRLSAMVNYEKPNIQSLDLRTMKWKYIDTLPEIGRSYADDLWTRCILNTSKNPRSITTPTSLYASDYGYHAGSLIYRGNFTANGGEELFSITTQGGNAYGHSVYLGSTFLGSWRGSSGAASHDQTFSIPRLKAGSHYIFTVVIDHMGLDMNFFVDSDEMKTPRGILNYNLTGHLEPSDISWKMTGNLGGEKYKDPSRGPLNEGALYAERQGYHLPGAPTTGWETRSPIDQGLDQAGLGFFVTTFDLDIPVGWDIPMALTFTNNTHLRLDISELEAYRVQVFVNGWQFGEYVNNIGPQVAFPIPEGILNHNGTNYLALSLWAQDKSGAKIEGLTLEPTAYIKSGYAKPQLSPGVSWTRRPGAY